MLSRRRFLQSTAIVLLFQRLPPLKRRLAIASRWRQPSPNSHLSRIKPSQSQPRSEPSVRKKHGN